MIKVLFKKLLNKNIVKKLVRNQKNKTKQKQKNKTKFDNMEQFYHDLMTRGIYFGRDLVN